MCFPKRVAGKVGHLDILLSLSGDTHICLFPIILLSMEENKKPTSRFQNIKNIKQLFKCVCVRARVYVYVRVYVSMCVWWCVV